MKWILLFLMFFSSQVWGQVEFAPVGAKWTLSKFWVPTTNTVELTVTEETLFEGMMAKKMALDENPQDTTSFIKHYYSYQSGDSIFFYYEEASEFKLIYDFSLTEGEILNVFGFGIEDWFSYRIDSVGTIIINDYNLKVQYISFKCRFDDDYGDTELRLVERIGALPIEGEDPFGFFFFENRCLLDSPKYVFRCYEDEDFGQYKIIEGECLISTATKDVDLEKEKIVLAPNPSSQQVTLTFSEPLFTKEIKVEVFSLEGISVLKVIKPKGQEILNFNIAHLTAGIYFIKIQNKQGFIQSLKMVKQ